MNKLLKPVMFLAFFLAVSLSGKPAHAQGIEVDYSNPKSYVVGGVNITGLKYLSAEQLIAVMGFREGDTVTLPSEEVSNAIKRLPGTVDASYVWMRSAHYSGKCVTRRLDFSSDGIDVFCDTNNSDADFIPDSTPNPRLKR